MVINLPHLCERRKDLSSHEYTVRTYVLKIPSVHNLFQRDDSQSKQFETEYSPFPTEPSDHQQQLQHHQSPFTSAARNIFA